MDALNMGTAAHRRGRRMSLLTVRLIATWTHAPIKTVRTWAQRGHIEAVACDVSSRAHLYDPRQVKQHMFRDTPHDA